MRARTALGALLATLIATVIPVSVNALSVADLQAQISSLLTQVSALQTQIAQLGATTTASTTITSTPTASGGVWATLSTSTQGFTCPTFNRTLHRGSTGFDVANLQLTLSQDPAVGYTAGLTSYFGAATEAALQRWQSAHGIITAGDPDSSGFGVFGPRSRALAFSLCKAALADVTARAKIAACSPVTIPPDCSGTIVNRGFDADGCSLGFSCIVSTSTRTIISSSTSTQPTTCTMIDCAQGYHASGPACSAAQTCVADIPQLSCTMIDCVQGYHPSGPACSLSQTCVAN